MLTQKRLKEVLEYDQYTGDFTRINCHQPLWIGTKAGCDCWGYVAIKIDNIKYLAHRLAWLYVYGYLPENQIDHINRNKKDNRLKNLREVSKQCNNRNVGNSKRNKSGVKGVSFYTNVKKWGAYISINNRNKSLGCRDDFLEAVCLRLAAEQCLDWGNCDSSSPAYLYVRKMIR